MSDIEDVLIVGSGFAGLCAAIKLKEAGFGFVILEKADSLGGTWRDNDYPGCQCDVESHFYSFSFAPGISIGRGAMGLNVLLQTINTGYQAHRHPRSFELLRRRRAARRRCSIR